MNWVAGRSDRATRTSKLYLRQCDVCMADVFSAGSAWQELVLGLIWLYLSKCSVLFNLSHFFGEGLVGPPVVANIKRRWISLIFAGREPHDMIRRGACLALRTGVAPRELPKAGIKGSPNRFTATNAPSPFPWLVLVFTYECRIESSVSRALLASNLTERREGPLFSPGRGGPFQKFPLFLKRIL